jgi:3-oxoacyl-[acyl-carrier protein] reductase
MADEQRLAIVTGGGRNIGRSIVFALCRQGRKVVAADIDEKNLAETKELAAKDGFEIITEKIDITNSGVFNDTIERLAKDNGGVGILVNNAGITRDNLLMRMSDDDFDLVISINLKAAFVACRASVRSMMRNKFGRIINISSVAGVMGNAGQTNYSSSKAGLIGMAKTIAKELGKKNITANCVAPGFIATDMIETVPDNLKELALKAIPAARFGSPEDIANAVAFLASDASGYITGQVLCVDGGMAM